MLDILNISFLELVVDHLFSESPRSSNSRLEICQQNSLTG